MRLLKKLVLGFGAFLLSTPLSPTAALALEGGSGDVPEVSGTYNDPVRKGIKVRVVVHKTKPANKPARPSGDEGGLLNCDLTDPDSSDIIGWGGWRLPASVSYRLNVSSVPASVAGANLPTIVGKGFNDWTEASGGKLGFTRLADTRVDRSSYDGQNVIAWGRTSGSTLGVTYIRYLPATGEVVDVDTIMNKRVGWKWSNSDTCAHTGAYDAENVMTHELGHWLGLDDEYSPAVNLDATMYGYASMGEVKKNTLSTGDRAGAFAIYN